MDKHKDQVYFTACFMGPGGLADTLNTYGDLRKLGLSIGYTYCHTWLIPTRPLITALGRWRTKNPYLNRSRIALRSFFGNVLFSNIFSFLGLNQLNIHPGGMSTTWNLLNFLKLSKFLISDTNLPSKNHFLKKPCCCITLSIGLLKENNISSYDALAHYVKTFVAERTLPGQPLFLVLRTGRQLPGNSIQKIFDAIPEPADPLDFRSVYFQQRKKRPQKSAFGKGHLKILVHLRLGDRAVANTPWGTWLHKPPWLQWQQSPNECDIQQLTTIECHRFVQGLLEHIPITPSVQVFSDGFGKTIYAVVHKGHKFHPPLTSPESSLLEKSLRDQQRLLTPLFESIPNSTCFFGEKPSQLRKLVHAAIEADLVITAFPVQQHLLLCLMRFYRQRSGTMPPVFLLHKPEAIAKWSVIKGKRTTYEVKDEITHLGRIFHEGIPGISFADISAPDFPGLAQRIMNHRRSDAKPANPASLTDS